MESRSKAPGEDVLNKKEKVGEGDSRWNSNSRNDDDDPVNPDNVIL